MKAFRSSWVASSLLLAALGLGALPGPPPARLSPEVERNRSQAAGLGLYRAPAARVVTPGLLARARTPLRPVTIWVYFTDKGVGTPASFQRARDGAAARLTPAARRRRESLGPDLGLDFRDLPVHADYVEALTERGWKVRRVSRWLNAVSAEGPAGGLTALPELPFVRAVRPVLVARGEPEPFTQEPLPGLLPVQEAAALDSVELAFYGSAYRQLEQIQVLDLHEMGYSGAGVLVMMLDTGFRSTHPAFSAAHVAAEWDFVNEDPETGPEAGDHPNQDIHGTGTWSVLGACDPGQLIGPAFGASFVLAKTEDITREVRAEEDNYVAALEWGDSLGVDVTSASLGYWTFDDSTGYTQADLDGDTGVITVAVDIAVSRGIACVNSAGNAGPNATTIGTPADADSVIAVGAVDSLGVIASFSSRGPTADGRIKPEICARGRITRWAVSYAGTYGTASGTSLSAPLIGGLVALLKEAHPGWSGERLREALMATGTQAGAPDNARGYGIAQGLLALSHGGETPAPPLMSRFFRLLSPASAASALHDPVVLVWSASGVDSSQVAPVYRVLLATDSLFTDPDTLSAGSDTTLSLPPLTEATYWWRVEAVSGAGYVRRSLDRRSFSRVSTLDIPGPEPIAGRMVLGPAFPNPTRGAATLSFRAPAGRTGSLDIFGVDGRLVRRFPVRGGDDEERIRWDGRDARGLRVPAGFYLARLQVGADSRTTRITLIP